MIRKNFKLNILLRLSLICILISTCLYFSLIEVNWLRFSYVLAFLLLVVWELLFYIDRINRDLATFFTALLQNDFTTSFMASRGKSFEELYSVLNAITKKFEAISIEKEQQLLFLEMLVENVKAGILSYDKNEKVHLMNHTLQRLLKKPRLHYLKAVSATDPELLRTLRDITSGQNKLLKIQVDGKLLQLSIHASEFWIGKEYFKLLSIQDIKSELEANEVETWQKLIRVLTHEIMNSVTPITSLTDTMLMMVKNKGTGTLQPQDRQNLLSGLEAVKARSSGLQHFTDTYRQLTKIPKPKFEKVNINELIQKTVTLHQEYLSSRNISLTFTPAKGELHAYADPALLSQVLVNIIKNAQEALSGNETAMIKISTSQGYSTEIRVYDNGPGMAPEIAEQIFVPFFTTKPQGSGIGLALCRQIMHLHKGSLTVETSPGQGAEFLLKF